MLLHCERKIDAQSVRNLYDHVGWWPQRTLADINVVLNSGDAAIGVWADGRLVGFARVVSDGKFRAFIEDVVVHEDFRHRGIASKMSSKLADELSHIETITLFCGAELVPLYQSRGFKGTRQVVMHRKGAQKG
ncbi:GNAT family N-acetyltransferase [Alicyclobacillus fodiniaquatilis]|uniref:GNAT family N-acetyltransferase n=1 Tax=Alicyclobacillus fodiniaquatilis TaxID=1661150 RepID=A0ABW4JFP3_9BACL